MPDEPIRFNDGAAYEQMMGKWSHPAGTVFLDWLAPPSELRWIDVGCGNGAFTELIVDRCVPSKVSGIDPSEGQLAFARSRPAARVAEFIQGDAQALPFPDKSFDAATMALVIFFVPDPAKGVAEMARVVRPGGIVAAYAWDILGGGFPWEAMREELRTVGVTPRDPPSTDASRIDVMHDLWTRGGLTGIETRQIEVQRTFANFDEIWEICSGPNIGAPLATMAPADVEVLKKRLRQRLPTDPAGFITLSARANAVKGHVPG